MFTTVCIILMIVVFGKLGLFAFKAAWGLTKVLLSLVFLPVILIGLILSGFFVVAIPVLVIVGLFAFLGKAVTH